MSHFKKGDTLKLINGDAICVDKQIGEGAMAEVSEALSTKERRKVAMKFMFGQYSTNNRLYYQKCRLLAHHNTPHPDLVWFCKDGITEFDEASQTFAFIMPCLHGYKSFVGAIKNPNLLTTRQKADACSQLAQIFSKLHKSNFVYGDVSANNAMYQVDSNGKFHVKLIDCDNITIPGHSLGLSGTGLYRAPEVIRGKSPSIQSDCHALAVLVFRILMKCHPLDGMAVRSVQFSPENVYRLFGEKPRFIFDGNENPAPTPVIERWKQLPYPMQVYFRAVFSQDCLNGKQERPDCSILYRAISMSYQ